MKPKKPDVYAEPLGHAEATTPDPPLAPSGPHVDRLAGLRTVEQVLEFKEWARQQGYGEGGVLMTLVADKLSELGGSADA